MKLKDIKTHGLTVQVKQRGRKTPDDQYVSFTLGNQLKKMGAKEVTAYSWKFQTPEAAKAGLEWAQAFINSVNEDDPDLFSVSLR
jgi:hypothetical protein